MADRLGKPLRAGDKIIYHSTILGMIFGELKYDEEAKAKYHLYVKEDGKTVLRYYQKPWKVGSHDGNVLNLTAFADALYEQPDLLDRL